MRTYMVIPSYWTGKKDDWQEGDKVFDHPTPLDEEGTLLRTLDSLNNLEDKDFTLIIIGITTNDRYIKPMEKKLRDLLSKAKIPVDTILFTETTLKKLKEKLYYEYKGEDILDLDNYAQIRNMCILLPYIMDAEIALLIDDDEIIEDPKYVTKAKEFIGKRFYGNTIDGVAGYYLNEDNEYYDKVNIVPWMTYWDRFGGKREAFDKIIGSEPRLKKTPFAFGGAMVIHRNLMRIVPFDPRVTRGEDTDYVINARIFGFNFYLDNTLALKHLPPPKNHPVWKSFREDIYRFLYDKSKFDTQSYKTNLHEIKPEEFDPYPGYFMKPDLGDKIFKTNIILALNYLADGDIKACKGTIENIYLARYDAVPHYNTFDKYLEFQKEWRETLEQTKSFGETLKNIIKSGQIIKYDKYQIEKEKILEKASIHQNLHLRDIEIFKQFTKKEIRQIFFISKVINLKKDEFVFKAGDFDNSIYVVLQGALEIIKERDSADHEIKVSQIKQGDHFNETSIFFKTKRNVSVVAITDVNLLKLDPKKFASLLEENTELSSKLLWLVSKKLSERLINTTEKFSESKDMSSDVSDHMEE
ncbi:MAG: cyclic nucleotide-binding domain-containing protein [Candidatus Cloacimonetes bacterium]|nr:cyclic nucleotide-binding domain-containing protein [Candidatus Cloacimonadota bacterium]